MVVRWFKEQINFTIGRFQIPRVEYLYVEELIEEVSFDGEQSVGLVVNAILLVQSIHVISMNELGSF